MKDPAFLFYPGDWLGGTVTFSRLQKGAYMDLLVAQFNTDRLSIEDIESVLGVDFPQWEFKLKSKFKRDENGLFYNERLDIEKSKRRKFTKSRRDNLEKKEIEDNDVEIGKKQSVFYKLVQFFVNEFGSKTCEDFFNYWSEPNKSNTKLRYELEATWHLHRRLKRWVSNDFNKTKSVEPARMIR